MTEHVTLSHKELDRLQIMTRIAERRLTQRHAGELLGLAERQIRRLYRAFKAHGAAGLVSGGAADSPHEGRFTRCATTRCCGWRCRSAGSRYFAGPGRGPVR